MWDVELLDLFESSEENVSQEILYYESFSSVYFLKFPLTSSYHDYKGFPKVTCEWCNNQEIEWYDNQEMLVAKEMLIAEFIKTVGVKSADLVSSFLLKEFKAGRVKRNYLKAYVSPNDLLTFKGDFFRVLKTFEIVNSGDFQYFPKSVGPKKIDLKYLNSLKGMRNADGSEYIYRKVKLEKC